MESKTRKIYDTPMGVKLVGTFMFALTFALMLFLPVFELIPESAMADTFTKAGIVYPHASIRLNVFEMMAYDHNGAVMGIMGAVVGICAILGITFLFANKPKASIVPSAIMFAVAFFTCLRSADTLAKNPLSSTEYFTMYKTSIGSFIYNILPTYAWLWVAVAVLLAVTIVAAVVSKVTEVEKKVG